MTILSLTSFAITVFLLAASPGPGVFAVIAKSVVSGIKAAVFMIAGIITGDIIYLMFAVFGLSVVAKILGELFIIVKLFGGSYICWLGLKIWLSDPVNITEGVNKKKSYMDNYFSGLILTLSNPKVILFYCGFLPVFINLNTLNIIDIFLTVSVVAIVLSAVLLFYAFIAARAGQFFSNKNQSKKINRVAGTLMMTAGVAVAVKS